MRLKKTNKNHFICVCLLDYTVFNLNWDFRESNYDIMEFIAEYLIDWIFIHWYV